MIQEMGLRSGERAIEFKMDLDPSNASDSAIAWYLQHNQVPEPEVVHLMLKVVREGDSVIDAGANVGFFSLLLSQLVGKTGTVAAIEPGSNNYPKLEANIKLNGIENIEVQKWALSDRDSAVNLYLYKDGGANACWPFDEASEATGVPGYRLDGLFLYSTPRLLKMDIEGSELKVLQGAHSLLRRKPPFIVMEFNTEALARMGASPEAIWHLLTEYGYDLFALNPSGGIPALIPRSSKLNITRQNTNVLFSTLNDVFGAWPEVVL